MVNVIILFVQANAAYFKGNWEQQFKKSNTKLALFYVSQKEVTPTMMMYQKGSFRHGNFSFECKKYPNSGTS